jgi:RHS repeat-associated protein
VSGGLAAGPPQGTNGTSTNGAGNPTGGGDLAVASAAGLRSDAVTAVPLHGEQGFDLITAVSGDLTTWLFEPESFAPLAKLTPAREYGIVTDHLGTPQSMYSADGEKSWELELSVYGDVRKLDGWRGECPFRYPGQYEDEETGLYYNRFRYYDAEVGGYLSQDPIGLLGGNPTIYAYTSDVNWFTDPFGLACTHSAKAKELGYRKTKFKSHGQAVYTNPKAPRSERFISKDADVHSGGFWKAADSPKNLGSKTTRSGTYDADLTRIAD